MPKKWVILVLNVGRIVAGTQFPEPVELKRCEKLEEDLYLLEALGKTSSRLYEVLFEVSKLMNIESS